MACLKNPPMFCQSPKTIAEHIDIIRFSNYNFNKDLDNEEFWNQLLFSPVKLSFSSGLLLTKYLIIPKMFEGIEIPAKLKGAMLKQKLESYLIENSDKNIS